MRITIPNPFTPTFGRVPYALVGRDELIDDVVGGLANQPGDPNRATIFIGPRGSGKTVLLTSIAIEASGMGWVHGRALAKQGLMQELYENLRKNALHILAEEADSHLTTIQVDPFSLGRELKPQSMASWRSRFESLVEELNARDVGVLFVIDEVDPACDELIDFIGNYQFMVTENRDVALLLAGLSGKVSDLLLDNHVSFIRRAFQRTLDPIPTEAVREALRSTVESGGKKIDDDALDAAAEATQGFAFAIQLIGYRAWRNAGDRMTIDLIDVEHAIEALAPDMERAIIYPSICELPKREMDYLRAMAVDDGTSLTSEIAQRMGISNTNAANIRRRLANRGLVWSPRMGVVVFEMPMLRDYLRTHPNNW